MTIVGVGGVGQVGVVTTSHRAYTPEEIADRCASKIINISATANPIIRQQAEAYRADIARVVTAYIKEAMVGERTTIYNMLIDAGEPRLAEMFRRL